MRFALRCTQSEMLWQCGSRRILPQVVARSLRSGVHLRCGRQAEASQLRAVSSCENILETNDSHEVVDDELGLPWTLRRIGPLLWYFRSELLR